MTRRRILPSPRRLMTRTIRSLRTNQSAVLVVAVLPMRMTRSLKRMTRRTMSLRRRKLVLAAAHAHQTMMGTIRSLRIRSLKRKMNLRRNVQLAVSADADST
jgi:hypothetical protein